MKASQFLSSAQVRRVENRKIFLQRNELSSGKYKWVITIVNDSINVIINYFVIA